MLFILYSTYCLTIAPQHRFKKTHKENSKNILQTLHRQHKEEIIKMIQKLATKKEFAYLNPVRWICAIHNEKKEHRIKWTIKKESNLTLDKSFIKKICQQTPQTFIKEISAGQELEIFFSFQTNQQLAEFLTYFKSLLKEEYEKTNKITFMPTLSKKKDKNKDTPKKLIQYYKNPTSKGAFFEKQNDPYIKKIRQLDPSNDRPLNDFLKENNDSIDKLKKKTLSEIKHFQNQTQEFINLQPHSISTSWVSTQTSHILVKIDGASLLDRPYIWAIMKTLQFIPHIENGKLYLLLNDNKHLKEALLFIKLEALLNFIILTFKPTQTNIYPSFITQRKWSLILQEKIHKSIINPHKLPPPKELKKIKIYFKNKKIFEEILFLEKSLKKLYLKKSNTSLTTSLIRSKKTFKKKNLSPTQQSKSSFFILTHLTQQITSQRVTSA